MRKNRLKQIWAHGGTALNAFLTIPSAWTAEVMSHIGYDAVTIDMQHGLADFQTTLGMLQAISTTDTVPLIRLQWNEPSMIMKVLDAGAMGLICPMISTRKDVEQFVGACRYPPSGYRSFGPIRASVYAGEDYAIRSAEEVLTFAMVETAASVDNLEDLATVSGLDGLFIGPYDLSVSMGLEKIANIHDPELRKVLEQVLQTAKKNNLFAGIYTSSVKDAVELAGMGFHLVSHTSDTSLLRENAQTKWKELKEKIKG